MASDKHFQDGVTPVGTARYPKITAPDTKGQYADNKYKTELVLDAAATKAFKAELQAAAKKWLPDFNNPHIPIRTDKKDGTVSFMFKSQHKPLIWDANGTKLPLINSLVIRGGSKIRVAYTLTNYDKGLSLWLKAIQIVELVGGGSDVAFDAVEGGSFAFDPQEHASTDEAPVAEVATTEQDKADKFNL